MNTFYCNKLLENSNVLWKFNCVSILWIEDKSSCSPILIKFIFYFNLIQFFKNLRINWFTRYSNHLRDMLSLDIFIYPGDWIAINYSWGSKILQVHNRYCTNVSAWFYDVSDLFKCLKITNDEKWNPNLLLNW